MNKEKFEELVNQSDRVLICVHDYPDPDALGAAYGLKALLETVFEKSTVIIGTGVSHPQNRTMMNVLNLPMMTPREWGEMDKMHVENETIIWVDFNENSGNNKSMQGKIRDGDSQLTEPNWIIDHHVDKQQTTNGWHIENVGSSCTLISEYMQMFGFPWDQEDQEHKGIATAMMLGIMTDTNGLLSQSVTARDLKAFEYLKQFYDQETFSMIMDYELDGYFADMLAQAIATESKKDGIVVICLGYLRAERRDAMPFVADLWRRFKNVNVVVVFAIIDNAVTGSVRVKGWDTKANELARVVFKSEEAGGHTRMAGGTAKFGAFFETDLLDEGAKREFLHAIQKIIVSRARNFAQLDE